MPDPQAVQTGPLGFTLAALLGCAPGPRAEFPVPAALAATPYAIGFRYIVVSDDDRPYRLSEDDVARPRPIAIGVWYPASPSGRRMTAGEYASQPAVPVGPAPAIGEARAAQADATAPWREAGAPPEAVRRALARRMRAVRNAPPAAGPYPLVLFAHVTIFGVSVMAEFLAGHGFVVAAVPSKDAAVGPYRLSVANVHAMARDLEAALERLRLEPFVRSERPAIIGMSNGALGAAALETRIGALAAFVSLDGTIGERWAVTGAVRLFGAASADLAFKTPLLHLYSPANPYLDLSLLAGGGWSTACQAAAFPDLRHLDFLSYPVLAIGVDGLDRSQPASVVRDVTRVLTLTAGFLESWTRPIGSGRPVSDAAPAGSTACADLRRGFSGP